MAAWATVRAGGPNPLSELVANDPTINEHLRPVDVTALFDISEYVGDAPVRARAQAKEIREAVPEPPR